MKKKGWKRLKTKQKNLLIAIFSNFADLFLVIQWFRIFCFTRTKKKKTKRPTTTTKH